jgi:hypothetical protein
MVVRGSFCQGTSAVWDLTAGAVEAAGGRGLMYDQSTKSGPSPSWGPPAVSEGHRLCWGGAWGLGHSVFGGFCKVLVVYMWLATTAVIARPPPVSRPYNCL